jgi:hypothetical protein
VGKTTSREVSLSALASFPPRIFRWAVDGILLATIFAFVLLFALQFTHSPRLLHFAWAAGLNRAGDLLLAETSSWIRLDWPVDTGFSFIPLGMALFVWLVKIGIDGLFLKAWGVFLRPSRAPQPVEAAGNSTYGRTNARPAHSSRPARNP